MNIVSYKNNGRRIPLFGCRRNYNKTNACPGSTHQTQRPYAAFSTLALLLSIALLSACPDDADNNNGSNTPTEFAYTCDNGTAVDGSTTDQDAQQNCASCDDGYAPSGTQCVQEFQYTCDNGTAVDGSTTDQDAQQNCASCDENYIPHAINGTTRQACTPTFEVLSNGVTIICPGIEVDGTFVIDGTTYTKRSRATITTDNAANTCTTGITDMSSMFMNDRMFNQDIGHWDVSMVNNMSTMFQNADMFDQDIGNWAVSMVSDMSRMFEGADVFNQDIGNWDVSMVSDMSFFMSYASAFDHNVGDWDVSMVGNMDAMFDNAHAFNQDLSRWCVSKINSKPNGFDNDSPIQSVAAHTPRWGTCPSS